MAGLVGQTLTNAEAMLWALKEARKGEGFVAPNPLVGCCILDRSHRLLSVGAHLKFGEAHAEVNALNGIEDASQLEGAKVFVTLEPCSKQGKTPSCAKTLSQLPIAEVHYACADPNPGMAGGAKILEASGISVHHFSEFQAQSEVLAEVFLLNQRKHRSFFHLKVATTLDGLITDGSGKSQWITSEESRHEVQRLRGLSDAVLIGRKTFEDDNPRLNSRHELFLQKQNFAVVLDPSGKTTDSILNSNLMSVRPREKVIIVVAETTECEWPDGVVQVSAPVLDSGELNLLEVGKQLHQLGISSVLVEGGGQTLSAFLRQGLGDRLSIFQSPSLMGLSQATHWLSSFETPDLSQRPFLDQVETKSFGKDFLITGNLKKNT